MRKLDLNILKTGVPVISEKMGAYLAEGAAVCLTMNGFSSGVVLNVEGIIQESFIIEWKDEISEGILQSWSESREAVEQGATALAVLILLAATDFKYFLKAHQGEGIDYWLGKDQAIVAPIPILKRDARLEISGILKESKNNSVNMRINQKKKQSKKTDKTGLPVYVAVIEFSSPKAKIVKK